MSDNDDKRTPIERTLDLPSLKEINEAVDNENPDKSNSNNASVEDDLDSYDDEDFISQYASDDFDEDDSYTPNYTPEEAKAIQQELMRSKKEIQKIKDLEYQNEIIKKYDEDVKDIHKKAINNFEDIMATALNMEPSQGSKYLSAATKLLETALSAKNSSFDRHLKMAELQLEREKENNKKDPREIKVPAQTNNGESYEQEDDSKVVGQFDRNSALREFEEEDDDQSNE